MGGVVVLVCSGIWVTYAEPKVRALLGADQRAISIVVESDDVLFWQQYNNRPLKDCTLTIDESFVLHVASLGQSETLPLREFARADGERFNSGRYKVQSVQVACTGISRTVKLD